MRRALLFFILISFAGQSYTQKVFTREGTISFYSEAPIENIEAHNHKATCVLDLASGKMEWAILIKAFQFKKALMQEHFNENYMESSRYPKATFTGQITNINEINFETDGDYLANVIGILTIRDIEKHIETEATFIVQNGKLSGSSAIILAVADFGIEIPGVVKDNIAKEVKVVIKANYEKLDR